MNCVNRLRFLHDYSDEHVVDDLLYCLFFVRVGGMLHRRTTSTPFRKTDYLTAAICIYILSSLYPDSILTNKSPHHRIVIPKSVVVQPCLFTKLLPL